MRAFTDPQTLIVGRETTSRRNDSHSAVAGESKWNLNRYSIIFLERFVFWMNSAFCIVANIHSSRILEFRDIL